MIFYAAAPDGATCEAGFREMTVTDGHPDTTVRMWRCGEPAFYVIPMTCLGCGHRTEVPYCTTHVREAVEGTINCILCPERTAHVDPEPAP